MGSTAWAAALMIVVAIVIALAFITLWMRDKDRADELADDPERTAADTRPTPSPGAQRRADGPE